MVSSLKENIRSSFIWTIIQAFGAKLISLVTQLILAWLILPEDYGKITLTFSITSIVFLIQGFGLSDVLISRSHMFDRILNLSKTISLSVGFIGVLISILAAFLAGYVYEDPEITYLILIFSLSIPINSLSIVAYSKLNIELRFRQLSIVRLTELFTTNLLTIFFVLIKVGIYSFVIAPVISSLLRYFLIHRASGVPHFFSITFSHWKYLFSMSLLGFLHNLSQTVIRHFDYIILGIYASKKIVGIYFMAYSLSVQVVALLVNSVSPTLFPALKRIPLSDKQSIRNALVKITSIFTFLGMPFAFCQMYVSEPLIDLFLSDKWNDSILIVKILSIGVGFSVASTVWGLSFRIVSRYKDQFKYSFSGLVFFCLITSSLGYFYKEVGVAIGVVIYQVCFSIIYLKASFQPFDINISEILSIIFKYFVVSSIVFMTGNYLIKSVDSWLVIIVNVLLFPCIYLYIMYLCDKKSKTLINFLIKEIKKLINKVLK